MNSNDKQRMPWIIIISYQRPKNLHMTLVHKQRSNDNLYCSTDGLVGYDIALTRRGSRVQFPLSVVVFEDFTLLYLFNSYYNIL